jgi:cytoskeletal protein RodZ
MAENTENQYRQSPQRSRSSATGWVLGVIIALAVIGVLWFYGTRDGTDITNTTTNAPVTTEPPAATTPVAPAEPPAATAPVTEPPAATEAEPPAATETAPATGTAPGDTATEPLPAPAPVSPVQPAPAPDNP